MRQQRKSDREYRKKGRESTACTVVLVGQVTIMQRAHVPSTPAKSPASKARWPSWYIAKMLVHHHEPKVKGDWFKLPVNKSHRMTLARKCNPQRLMFESAYTSLSEGVFVWDKACEAALMVDALVDGRCAW